MDEIGTCGEFGAHFRAMRVSRQLDRPNRIPSGTSLVNDPLRWAPSVFRQTPSRALRWRPACSGWRGANQNVDERYCITTRYSARKAMIGSVCTARQAGNILAAKATSVRIEGTTIIVPRSCELVL
jgi:hypothetical protein